MLDPRQLYDSDDITWLARPDNEVEGPLVERKQGFQPDEVARQVSAFANGRSPGGLIVIGVTSKGNIAGVDESDVNQKLPSLARLVDGPPLEHRLVAVSGQSKPILYLFVPFCADRVVCLADGTAHRREGSSTLALRPEEIAELRHQRGERPFEDEPAVPLTDDALDIDLAKGLLEEMTRRNGLTMPLDQTTALRSRHLLVDRSGQLWLTMAGLLAVGARPSAVLGGARVRFQKFDGTEDRVGVERNVVKDMWFDGPLPRLVPAVRDFIRTQVREFDYLGSDGRFVTDPEYPEPAWEEAVVNAVVHRSYSLRNATIFIRMFDDRLEVESPGSLPFGVRPDNLFSCPRNPHLASVLQYFQLVHLAQEGTRRMKLEMERLRLPPPEIAEVKDRTWVRVVLRNDIERQRSRQGTVTLIDEWQQVLALLRDRHSIARRRGIGQWRTLRDRGAQPTPEVVGEALRLVQDESFPVRDRADTVNVLMRENLATRLRTIALLAVPHVARQAELSRNIAYLAAEFDESLAALLPYLESGALGSEPASDFFRSLEDRISNNSTAALPASDLLDRVLALCRVRANDENARRLYQTISGEPLPEPPRPPLPPPGLEIDWKEPEK